MTIQRRLQVGAGILVLFILGTVWLLYWSSRQVDKGIRATETVSQVARSAYSLVVLLNEYHDYGSNRALEQWERNRDSLGQLVNKLDSESPSFAPELQQTLRDTLEAVNSLSPQVPRMTFSRVSGGEPQDEKSKDMLSSLMFLRLEDLLSAANDLSDVVQSATLGQRQFAEAIIVGAGISLFVLLLINIYAVRNSIVNPLAALSAGAERIGQGQFDYVAETKRDDEVGKLAQAFNAMIARLGKRDAELTKAKDELQLTVEERTAALQRVGVQNELLEAVQRSQTQFITETDSAELYGSLLHELLTLTNSEFGFVDELVYSEDGKRYLKAHAITDISWDETSRQIYKKFAEGHGLEFPEGQALGWRVIHTGEPVISNDPANDPRSVGTPEGHPSLQSFLGLPLVLGGAVIGCIGMANRHGGYDQQIVELLQPYLATCANIIEAYRNEERRRETERQLQQKLDALRQAEDLAQLGYFERNWQNGTGYWSDGFYKLLDLEPGIVPSHEDYENYVHEEDRKRFVEYVRDSLNSRNPMNIEYRMVQESGNVIHVHAICESTYDADGKPAVTRGTLQDITARKMDEERLRDSEEMFRSVFETSTQGIMLTAPDGTVYRANKAAQDLLGRSEEEILEVGRDRVIDFDDPRLKLALEERSRTGCFIGELNYRRKDGTVFPAFVSSSLFPTAKGEMRCSIIFQDITERKLAEETLKRNKERIEADLKALTRMHELVMKISRLNDFKAVLQEIMDVAVAIVGADRGTLQLIEGDSLNLVAHYAHEQPFIEFFKVVTSQASVCGEATKHNKRVIVEDVEISPLFTGTPSLEVLRSAGVRSVQSTPLVNRNGNLIGILTTQWSVPHTPDEHDLWRIDLLAQRATDFIENWRAGEALRKSHDELEMRVQERTAELEEAKQDITVERQRLYDVLETLPVYVCLLDSDYRMPFANRYFRETFAKPLGRRCHDFLFNLTEPCEICDTYTVMKTRAPHHWYWTGPNGRDYDIYDFPFFEADGSMLILEMGIDITERNKAEASLKQTLAELTRSNEDLQQFAYVASHDLQEPLRNVASCLQMLEKKYKNNLGADGDQYIHHAVEGAVRMKALITDLLEYSRVATRGKLPKRTDCEQLLDQTLKNLRMAISEAGAMISHDPLPAIFGDDSQLLLVFQNLLQNAIKFRKDVAPEIHVSAVKNKKEWIFSIKDNGIGIESQHLDRIFVIFQRLHKRSQYDGTGMGLAIVKKVVERHGGRIWVVSEPRAGSTFYFTIPEKGMRT
jgi:PAS domain S-box-containing protein